MAPSIESMPSQERKVNQKYSKYDVIYIQFLFEFTYIFSLTIAFHYKKSVFVSKSATYKALILVAPVSEKQLLSKFI